MTDITPVTEKKHRIRGFFRTVFNFNFRKWIAADEIVTNSKTVANAYLGLFEKEPGIKHKETFAEAMQRLRLTEDMLQKKRNGFLYFSLFYLILALGLISYAFYLLINKAILLAFFVSFILGILILCYAYRENFWYMQISKRKLGCTFKEWLSFVFMRAQK